MPTYTLVVKPSGPMERIVERLQNLEPLLNELADDVLQILARNWQSSGIQTHSGVMKSAVTKRGAKGNILSVSSSGVRVGIDYATLPYARFVIEGRGPVQAKRAKALHFDINGKSVFAKSVKAAPPHRLYYLTQPDLLQLETDLSNMIAGKK
jgi:hypothetical protein